MRDRSSRRERPAMPPPPLHPGARHMNPAIPRPTASRRRLCALALLLASATQAQAQTAPAAEPYPSRPVTIIVPFPAGGGTDLGARLLAQKLAQKWGQGVVVDNRGGAAGLVGADLVAKA